MQETAFNLPTLQNRFEKAGTVSKEQLLAIGAVGIPARGAGIHRDVRTTHPHLYYPKLKYQPAIMQHGDILSQAQVKNHEIQKSIAMVRRMVDALDVLDKEEPNEKPDMSQMSMKPSHLAVSMVEAWRGELCHVAITNENGELAHYKVKDPSMHNWLALALAVRNNEISDFPICNKGFDLSYCGHDL